MTSYVPTILIAFIIPDPSTAAQGRYHSMYFAFRKTDIQTLAHTIQIHLSHKAESDLRPS